ncbi:MAG: hypothetical protein ABEI58_04025 [Candidatus Nanohaloarchaea archaeon]
MTGVMNNPDVAIIGVVIGFILAKVMGRRNNQGGFGGGGGMF